MHTKQQEWDMFFLGMAKYTASKSKDPSTKVGAVISRPNNRIVSVGFNGFPQKMNDSAHLYLDRDIKLSRTIHAEMNALLFANRDDCIGATLYTWPAMSCDRCFVHMIQAGIVRFVFPEATADMVSRWQQSFDRVAEYGKEVNAELVSYDPTLIV
jgi:dCMP deaminase